MNKEKHYWKLPNRDYYSETYIVSIMSPPIDEIIDEVLVNLEKFINDKNDIRFFNAFLIKIVLQNDIDKDTAISTLTLSLYAHYHVRCDLRHNKIEEKEPIFNSYNTISTIDIASINCGTLPNRHSIKYDYDWNEYIYPDSETNKWKIKKDEIKSILQILFIKHIKTITLA